MQARTAREMCPCKSLDSLTKQAHRAHSMPPADAL